MKSGLTPLFSDADIDRWFDKFQERAEERIFRLPLIPQHYYKIFFLST